MYAYVDDREIYRYVNRRYEQCHDRPADQIVGRSVRQLLGPENYAVAKPHIDKVVAGEADRCESPFEFPDGTHMMDVVCAPDREPAGRIRGFYVLVHDITERKALERRLHDREERLRAIVNTAADRILTVDREGIIRDFNPAAERIFGHPAAAVINQDARRIRPA